MYHACKKKKKKRPLNQVHPNLKWQRFLANTFSPGAFGNVHGGWNIVLFHPLMEIHVWMREGSGKASWPCYISVKISLQGEIPLRVQTYSKILLEFKFLAIKRTQRNTELIRLIWIRVHPFALPN